MNRMLEFFGLPSNGVRGTSLSKVTPQARSAALPPVAHSFHAVLQGASAVDSTSTQFGTASRAGREIVAKGSHSAADVVKSPDGLTPGSYRLAAALAGERAVAPAKAASSNVSTITTSDGAANYSSLSDSAVADPSAASGTDPASLGALPPDPNGMVGPSPFSTGTSADANSGVAPLLAIPVPAEMVCPQSPGAARTSILGSTPDGAAATDERLIRSKSFAIEPAVVAKPVGIPGTAAQSGATTQIAVTASERHLAPAAAQLGLVGGQAFPPPASNDGKNAVATDPLKEPIGPGTSPGSTATPSLPTTHATPIGIPTSRQMPLSSTADNYSPVDATVAAPAGERGAQANGAASAIAQQVLGSIKSQLDSPQATAFAPEPGKAVLQAEPGAQPNPLRVLVVRLEPAELGIVKVRLSLTGNALSVKLEAEAPETAALLSTARDALADDLRAAGHIVDDIGVAIASDSMASIGAAARPDRDSQGPAIQGASAGMSGDPSGRSPESNRGNRPALPDPAGTAPPVSAGGFNVGQVQAPAGPKLGIYL